MFKEFMTGVISLAFLCTISNMLMPEGTLKKYLSLTFGFMMIATLIMPMVKIKDCEPFEFSFDYDMNSEEINAKSDAYILELHEENIRKHIKELFGENAEVFIELYADGRVKSVDIYTEKFNLTDLEKLKKTLGCDNIEVKKRSTNDT